MITICLTYFRSLTLANLAAALYSVRQQDLSRVEMLIVVDNDTVDAIEDIRALVESFEFPIQTCVLSFKHGDLSKTHAWSTNVAVRAAMTPWVLFTRADYILDFNAVTYFLGALTENQFVVGGYYDIEIDIQTCDRFPWRVDGPQVLRSFGREYDHVLIDAGVWMLERAVFEQVGGLDERLTAWGHAQTHFQHKLFMAGVTFVRLPYVVFYHPAHEYETPKDITLAHRQLKDVTGLNVTECWDRYTGPDHPYVGLR